VNDAAKRGAAHGRTLGNEMNRRATFLVSILVLVPCVALADVGTPLVWATGFHMLLGNAILGFLEGILLAKVFSLGRDRCIGLLIAANYFSAWFGMFIVGGLGVSQEVDLYNAVRVTAVLVGVTYLFTLLLEWPFVALCFGRTPCWFSRSLKASLLIQTLSYLLLFSGFWLVSGKSLYSEFTIVPATDQNLPDGVRVYFISSVDGNVYRRSRATGPDLVASLGATNVSDYLRFQQSNADTNTFDLVAVLDRRQRSEEVIVISEGIVTNPTDATWMTYRYWGWGSAPQIGSATNSTWHFSWGHWPTVGIYGDDSKTGQRIRLAFGNPMIQWPMWRAIHLPEDMILFQLGLDQLCLLDVKRKTVSLWDRGHGPVALESEREKSSQDTRSTQ